MQRFFWTAVAVGGGLLAAVLTGGFILCVHAGAVFAALGVSYIIERA